MGRFPRFTSSRTIISAVGKINFGRHVQPSYIAGCSYTAGRKLCGAVCIRITCHSLEGLGACRLTLASIQMMTRDAYIIIHSASAGVRFRAT